MSKQHNGLNPARRQFILWLAQINSVVVLTVLAWVLPGFNAVAPVPSAQQPLLIAALVALPLTLALGRWLMARAGGEIQRGREPVNTAAAASSQADVNRLMGFSVLAWALCELPLVLGFVYALLGGDRLHAMALGAASLVLLLLLRPSSH
ncbi:hypothetical protein Thiowin_04274 [Thiorhodovibrio winogradskyi]|uniref:MFS transporter n=1 Tax=Thiorhodovibrio winogradskyi TaxID=77007 RepID=A0ABZ0SGC0_9GAMM|nr:hypothetical protein [Thiorhodovibrio winogradskyi]